MSLIKEISAKLKEINRTSSEKDRIFYKYLTDKPIELLEDRNPLDVIKICYSAFAKKFDEKNLVERLQKTQPMKGLHYTNNLVELIAIALHDFEGEKDNLQKYIDSHNAKEAYLINKIFPEIKYKTPVKVETTIDRLVNEVFIENNLKNGEEKILEAIKDANDLLDVYVIEQALKVCYELHPSIEDKRNIKYLLSFYLRLHKILYGFFSLIFYASLIGPLVYGIYIFTPAIVANWDKLEPYTFIIQNVGPIILMIILTGLGWKFKLIDFIKPTQKKIVYLIEVPLFKLIGIDLSKILEIQSTNEDAVVND